MTNGVYEYITKYGMISENDVIVAGVSGGADSVCLLLQLCEYRKKVKFDLQVVHINHMIRGDAAADANYVQELCTKLEVPFHLYNEDVLAYAKENGLSSEEAGRIIRYRAFNEVLQEINPAGKIAIAHNRNDVAETVMFNMFRGTGLEGLCSLNPVNGNIIRPILCLSRSEIEKYLEDQGISYRTDSTNLGNDYARNRIRNVMLPYADENMCSNATEHVAALSDKMRLVREYIKKQCSLAFDECVRLEDEAQISLDRFKALDELIKQEVLLEILDRMTTGRKDICDVHINSIMELLDKEGEKRISLPYGLEAVKRYDILIIRKRNSPNTHNVCINIEPGTEFQIGDGRVIISRVFEYDANLEIPQKAYTKWFDYDKISNCLVLRNRISGDYLTINSSMAKKSLKDYLINEKIPKEDRDSQLLLADGNHVMWVVDHRISEYYKVSSQTRNILEIVIR